MTVKESGRGQRRSLVPSALCAEQSSWSFAREHSGLFFLNWQSAHAVEAYAQSGQVVEHGGGCRGQDTRYARPMSAPVEADNETVVVLDAAHQSHGQLPQAHQLPQAVSGDGDVGDLPGDGRPSLMAMPASASERAGESLMPSPTMRTVRPSRRRAAT